MSNTKDDPVGVFLLFGNIWEIRNDILHHGFCVQGLFCQNGNNFEKKNQIDQNVIDVPAKNFCQAPNMNPKHMLQGKNILKIF